MRPFRIRALTALLSLALMLFAAVPASADPGDGGAKVSRKAATAQKVATPHLVDPGDGGALRDPGDGGVVTRDPGDGGVINSDPGDGGGVTH